jgi:hypothetical protein
MQYAVGHWICWAGDASHKWRPLAGNWPAVTAQDLAFHRAGEGRGRTGMPWTYKAAREFVRTYWAPDDEERPTIIVLTTAHLNHQPEDCRPENLAAMCQRHHLAYDQEHHRQTAYATRRARFASADLFAG